MKCKIEKNKQIFFFNFITKKLILHSLYLFFIMFIKLYFKFEKNKIKAFIKNIYEILFSRYINNFFSFFLK